MTVDPAYLMVWADMLEESGQDCAAVVRILAGMSAEDPASLYSVLWKNHDLRLSNTDGRGDGSGYGANGDGFNFIGANNNSPGDGYGYGDSTGGDRHGDGCGGGYCVTGGDGMSPEVCKVADNQE